MADVFERDQPGKYYVFTGADAEPEWPEGTSDEAKIQVQPWGDMNGTANRPDDAKMLAGMWPEGRLYQRVVIERYVPVDPATLPDPVEEPAP